MSARAAMVRTRSQSSRRRERGSSAAAGAAGTMGAEGCPSGVEVDMNAGSQKNTGQMPILLPGGVVHLGR